MIETELCGEGLSNRLHRFIQEHLGDPCLSPGAIAEAHHISIRYLHKLFAGGGMTVAGRIRELRLERCYRDLADPSQRDRPIHSIAARWGFTDKAHFSRLFRARYGIPPKEYRRKAYSMPRKLCADSQPPCAQNQRHPDLPSACSWQVIRVDRNEGK